MKVLIVSHNPITTQNNMGITFLSLFSQFEKQELCQLYIYPTLPNADRCSSFYRVTDKEILLSLVRGKKAGGEIRVEQIRASEGLFEKAEDEAIYRSKKNKTALRRLLRDAMWSVARWYSPQLREWLKREGPECIFVAPGVAKFVHGFVLRISRDLNIPIITYICDEYYFVRRPDQLLDRLRLTLLQRKMRSLMACTSHLVVISEELKEAYAKEFGVKTTTLMTGAGIPVSECPKGAEQPKEICYFGNIRCNRYLSLCEIGRELDEINRELGESYKLKIYTFEKDREILGSFEGIASVELCGAVTGKDFEKAFNASQLLLHVEAFDEKSIDFVQHSVSTKIADSLASGIPLLAYGPECISSMRHLLRHECAITATGKQELRSMLMQAFSDQAARRRVAENGLRTAREYHDRDRNGEKLRGMIGKVIENHTAGRP